MAPARSLLSQRVEQLRKSKKLSQAGLSKLAVLGNTAVHEIEKDKNKNPSRNVLESIARVLGTDVAYLIGETDNPERRAASPTTDRIPVIGIVEAGAFRKMDDISVVAADMPSIDAPRSERFPRARHFAMEVRGNSMNAARPAITEGMFVLCVDIVDAGIDVESGSIYVVRKTRDNGQTYECTLKRARIFKDRVELVPESTDSRYEKFILPTTVEPDDSIQVEAIGKVYGLYTPLE